MGTVVPFRKPLAKGQIGLYVDSFAVFEEPNGDVWIRKSIGGHNKELRLTRAEVASLRQALDLFDEVRR